MQCTFIPKGVCSRQINLDIEKGKIKSCEFIGGCNGNLKAICKLIQGLPVDQVIEKLQGITCNNNPTSCPDQLAKALQEHINRHPTNN